MIHIEFYLEGSDRNDLFDYACTDHIPTIGSKVCLKKHDYKMFSVVDIEFWFDDQCHRPDQVQTAIVLLCSETTIPSDLKSHFKNADIIDWEYLYSVIPDSGHGRFWKATFDTIRKSLLNTK